MEEKEKKENIWRGRIYFVVGEKKNGEGKGEGSLEKEKETNIWRRKIYFLVEEKKNRKGKIGNYLEKKIMVTPTV